MIPFFGPIRLALVNLEAIVDVSFNFLLEYIPRINSNNPTERCFQTHRTDPNPKA